MTCENCVHFEVCAVKGKRSRNEYSKGKVINTIYSNIVEKTCKHFKDKSKIIDLPCNMGNKIFKFKNINGTPTGEIVELSVNGFVTVLITSPYNAFDIEEIGKTVFLTKEEAEQKLKEMQK